MGKRKIQVGILLFFVALTIRLSFYFIASSKLPPNLQKFVTADTVFYYDPIALEMASGSHAHVSLLSVTRFTFLGYLSLFYRYLGHWYLPVSIFHCFLGALSVVFLFLATRLFLGEKIALAAGLVASFQVVLVYWTPFVTTEAAFLLLLSISIYLCVLFLKTKNPLHLFSLIVFLIIMPLSRPLGITFSVFMLLYLEWIALKKIFKNNHATPFFLINAVLLIIALFCMSRFANKIDKVIAQDYPQTLLQMSLYLDEMPKVVAGRGHIKFYSARLSLPTGIAIPKSGTVSGHITTADIFSYFKNYYHKFFVLMACRIYTLFNPWVPEYSLKHNVFNVLFYVPIYIFSIMGFFVLKAKERAFADLLLICIASQVFLIALTLVDYDFRLRLPLEFIMTIPCGVGLHRLLTIKSAVFSA